MFDSSRWTWVGVALLTSGLAAGAIATTLPSTPVSAAPDTTAPATTPTTTSEFPDVPPDYWAQPFISRLAERNIIVGYLDGTYRPETPMDRDEFAAIVRESFNQESERQLAAGSVYEDVPEGYWAAPAIEEAYEMGFMRGSDGSFRPQQTISRVEALMALATNLDLGAASAEPRESAAATTPAPPEVATIPTTIGSIIPSPSQPRQARRRPLVMLPMAMTTLIQPLITPRANAANVPAAGTAQAPAPVAEPEGDLAPMEQPVAGAAAVPVGDQPASDIVSNYYTDADQIPQEAMDAIADATEAGIVVNYPERNTLNPSQPATRGEVAAFIHQALVEIGRLEPISADTEVSNYIVNPE